MGKKILVIDDEELIIRSLTKLLEKKGYDVFVVKNGRDALVMTEEESYDLIIADIRMPGINGVETIKSIYDVQLRMGENKTPTIFITGYADKDIEKEARSLNPVAYINKPFDIPNLLNKIEGILQ